MILGTGVDIIEIRRVERLLERGSPLDRIFTEAEIKVCRDEGFSAMRTAARLAGLFAAKEAVMKAMGTGWAGGVAFSDIQVAHDPSGRPEVSLKGRTAEIAASMGVEKVHVSISHDRTRALAFAVLEGSPRGES